MHAVDGRLQCNEGLGADRPVVCQEAPCKAWVTQWGNGASLLWLWPPAVPSRMVSSSGPLPPGNPMEAMEGWPGQAPCNKELKTMNLWNRKMNGKCHHQSKQQIARGQIQCTRAWWQGSQLGSTLVAVSHGWCPGASLQSLRPGGHRNHGVGPLGFSFNVVSNGAVVWFTKWPCWNMLKHVETTKVNIYDVVFVITNH